MERNGRTHISADLKDVVYVHLSIKLVVIHLTQTIMSSQNIYLPNEKDSPKAIAFVPVIHLISIGILSFCL
jgi:hypothetical protein